MSRIRWGSLVKRDQFEFLHTTSGRLQPDALPARHAKNWAVCGGETFVRRAVPALRTAGVSVTALSVLPKNFHNVSSRLRAQDAQDSLCRTLNVPCGLSVEALPGCEEFDLVLLEEADERETHLPSTPLRILDALDPKVLVRAPLRRLADDVHGGQMS